jgi:hypothetical protein
MVKIFRKIKKWVEFYVGYNALTLGCYPTLKSEGKIKILEIVKWPLKRKCPQVFLTRIHSQTRIQNVLLTKISIIIVFFNYSIN